MANADEGRERTNFQEMVKELEKPDGIGELWTGISPARIRAFLMEKGFVISEKRAKQLKAEVLLSRAKEICANCSAPAGFSCSLCNHVKYCSKECQRANWKAHKASCKGHATKSEEVSKCPVCTSAWSECRCEEKPSCWICLESNGTLLRGCACRGGAGYFIHFHSFH